MVSSVDAIVCVATTAHSGSHLSHGPTSPMATWRIDEHVSESAIPV